MTAALQYVATGWAVFPLHTIRGGHCTCRRDCPHPAKHPRTRHGLHDATTDPDTVRAWWGRWPTANVAVRTGATSGLVVVDVDPASGGEDSLDRLETLMGRLPATLTALTGGGAHLYYHHPGTTLGNTCGRLPGVTEPLPGIDLRADGGYVVAPPSRHASGHDYIWDDPSVGIATPPHWLGTATRTISNGTRRPLRPARMSGYATAALGREAADVRAAAIGERNNRLNRAAFSLGTLVGAGALDTELVEDVLLAAARDAGLPEHEAEASIASGLRAGARRPRRRADP